MGLHDVVLPSALIGYGSSMGPGHMTSIPGSDSGLEDERFPRMTEARQRFNLENDDVDLSDARDLLAFSLARQGQAHSFLLIDPTDNTTATDGTSTPLFNDVSVGVGDGINTEFFFLKYYELGNNVHIRRLHYVVPGVFAVGLGPGGAPVQKTLNTDYTVDHHSGRISFVTAPPAGETITCGCQFYNAVRFFEDEMMVSYVAHETGSTSFSVVQDLVASQIEGRIESLPDTTHFGGGTDHTSVIGGTFRLLYSHGRLNIFNPVSAITLELPPLLWDGSWAAGSVAEGGPWFVIYNTHATNTITLQKDDGTMGGSPVYENLLQHTTVPAQTFRTIFLDDNGIWRAR